MTKGVAIQAVKDENSLFFLIAFFCLSSWAPPGGGRRALLAERRCTGKGNAGRSAGQAGQVYIMNLLCKSGSEGRFKGAVFAAFYCKHCDLKAASDKRRFYRKR